VNTRLNFFSSEFITDPYPVYEVLRETAPYYFDENHQMLYFSRHKDISDLLRDKRFGRANPNARPDNEPASLAPFRRLDDNSLMDKEPPDHTRLRGLVQQAFTPRRVEALSDNINDLANRIMDQIIPAGTVDLLEDFAVPISVNVISDLLGIPDTDRHNLRPWSNAIVRMYEVNPTDGDAREAVAAVEEFSDYLHHLIALRKESPANDLITALIQARQEGDRLSEDELISTCILLLNAGHEATVNVIGNGVHALLNHPEQMSKLRTQPELMKLAVEEMVRFDSPLQLFRRWVMVDTEYHGLSFKKGARIGLLFGSANRDADVFDHPNRFDVTRTNNPHMGFGAGIHYCLGAPLARLELRIAMDCLFKRVKGLDLVEEPVRRPTFVIRGYEQLRVRLIT